MSRLFAVGGPVLAGLGAALDGGHMDGPRATLVLLVASCLAWPGRAALGLGLVGLASVMAPEAVADGTANGWSAAGLVAVAIGLSARSLESRLSRDTTAGDLGPGLWLTGLALCLALLPDGHLFLVDAQGGQASVMTVIEDAATGTRRAVAMPVVMDAVHPASWLVEATLWLSPIAFFLLLVAHTQGQRQWMWSDRVTMAVGALLLASGLWGWAQLLGGQAPALSTELLGARMGQMGGGGVSVTLGDDLSAVGLSLASRPMVDGLRLAVGVLVLGWVFVRRGDETTDAPGAGIALTPSLSLSLVLGLVAILLVGDVGMAWGLSAGLVAGVIALLLNAVGERGLEASVGLHQWMLILWVAGVLATTAGWATG